MELALFGPPLVRIAIGSTTCTAFVIESVTANTVVGISSGNVMDLNFCHSFAPSSVAAS